MTANVLVTGAKGCIGAWTVRALLEMGHHPIGFDLPGNLHRLQLVLGDRFPEVTLVDGDILDPAALTQLLQDQQITHIIHLAALQVPAVRAKPTLGMQVNAVGTVNIFEAAKTVGIKHISYASSIAAYSPDMTFEPATLYGVSKVANEGTARVYFGESGINSIALRPNTVYGLGRDFGLTSSPTFAMLAAAAGKGYHIPYGAQMLYQTGHDMGSIFARAGLATDFKGAEVFDAPGDVADTARIIDAIHATVPDVEITYDKTTLPFPSVYDTSALDRAIGPTKMTPLREGVAETIEGFRQALAAGRIAAP